MLQTFFSCVISIYVEGDLVIAKVDSTKNEIDGVDIEGFPTIKMFKKESNEEIEYIGRIIVVFCKSKSYHQKCLYRKERFGVNGKVH